VNNPYSNIKESHLAYIAGFLDGEGTISIVKVKRKDRERSYSSPYYRPILVINNTNREILEWIKSVFGAGQVNLVARKEMGRKPVYRWIVGNAVAIQIAEILYPHLRVKKLQADVVMQYKSTVPSKYNVYGNKGLPIEIIKERDSFVETLRCLNKRGLSN